MLLWNCEKTENLDEQATVTELHQSKLANFKAYRPKADLLFRTKPKLVELLKSKFKTNKEELQKSKTSNIYGFTIDKSYVEYMPSNQLGYIDVILTNPTSINSLLLHLGKNCNRDGSGKNYPLSTIIQYYHVSIKIN